MLKIGKNALVCVMLIILGTFPAYAGQWQRDSRGWWYQNDNGSYPRSTWQQIDGAWYCFDGAGYMLHDTWINGYYVGSDGKMLKNTITGDGFMVNGEGQYIPGSGDYINGTYKWVGNELRHRGTKHSFSPPDSPENGYTITMRRTSDRTIKVDFSDGWNAGKSFSFFVTGEGYYKNNVNFEQLIFSGAYLILWPLTSSDTDCYNAYYRKV